LGQRHGIEFLSVAEIIAMPSTCNCGGSDRGAGARLFYLPKYSPDLNPIEQFFAKFKHWLRKAARRTTEAVYDAIAPILDTVSPAECANYFANAGYHQI
jgi:transposase